jgi:hypothetical protein
MLRKVSFAALAAVVMASSANAAMILGVVVDPATTSGGGATSTRTGAGTFQLYVADDNAGSLGLSSYNVTMGALVTASNNRAPQVNGINDSNGDTQPAGFTLLRSASNAPAMQGSEPLPGSTGAISLITGFGQTASSFTAFAASQPQPASLAGTPTSGSWGGPYSPAVVQTDYAGTTGNKKWMFLGEGTYAGTVNSALQIASGAVFTNFATGSPTFTSVASPTSIVLLGAAVPEPATMSLLGLAMIGGFGFIRRRAA